MEAQNAPYFLHDPCLCRTYSLFATDNRSPDDHDGSRTADSVLLVDKHDPFQLSDILKSHLADPLTPVQVRAFAQFQELLNDRTDGSLVKLIGQDDARPLGRERLKLLLKVLQDMFFPGNFLADFKFLAEDDEALGRCGSFELNLQLLDPPRSLIFLHPLKAEENWYTPVPPKGSILNQKSMMRLGTLLHELCHGYLGIYVCKQCSLKRVLVDNLEGHGAAWQRVASYVEHAAQQQLGLTFELGRFDSPRQYWNGTQQQLTLDEFDSSRLKDRTLSTFWLDTVIVLVLLAMLRCGYI